jgi:hypothetical protein
MTVRRMVRLPTSKSRSRSASGEVAAEGEHPLRGEAVVAQQAVEEIHRRFSG